MNTVEDTVESCNAFKLEIKLFFSVLENECVILESNPVSCM